ncbi:type IV pilus biogenesis/stability protein PilW [Modicisalibacter xianhensis]|uniref:Type IV pilus assembly protein PilF n=1 Tax=Modicisalibacter xianhensis TaxID=442341 RepID=A0A1I2YVS8_9GAMM|nr:type IV pilus biogenesis/stability protein PilW [Halomonas xianhensis]TDX31531.1 type IV pilus assembly protein PilF [Halomonas xianhensis]SFH29732.1 type IV pilus assembly protein PilF [Halomonas xianhensis]
MIRRCRSSSLTRLCAVTLGVLWLSGCTTTTLEQPTRTADLDQALKLNVTMGIEYMEQGNLRRAQDKLDRALEIAPDDPGALQAQALLYQRQGETTHADRFFQRALAEAPDFTRARNNYAAFLFAQGRIEASCEQLERATQDLKYDNRAQLYTNLGICQRELGDLQAARASLERAQAIDPRNARTYLTLAQINHAQGNDERAWEQLQTFIRLAGMNPEGLRLAQRIASARGDAVTAAFYSRQLDEYEGAP